MYCHNCGAQLKDGAKFCHECGQDLGSSSDLFLPIEPIDKCSITLTRDKAFSASLISMCIYIDGQYVGSLPCGKSVDIPCSYGEHTLTVTLNSHSISRLVYVPDETELFLTVDLLAKPEFTTSYAAYPPENRSYSQSYYTPPSYTPPVQQNVIVNNISHNGKEKNKWIAFLLCIFLGVLGFHKFYEGKIFLGIIYMFTLGLCGFGVLIDAIVLLCKPNPYYV